MEKLPLPYTAAVVDLVEFAGNGRFPSLAALLDEVTSWLHDQGDIAIWDIIITSKPNLETGVEYWSARLFVWRDDP